MSESSSVPRRNRKADGRIFLWFQRNERSLIVANVVCITLLFFMQLFTSTIRTLTPEIMNVVQLAAMILVCFITLPIVWKGAVPLIICILGVGLMYSSVMLPYFGSDPGDAASGNKPMYTLFTRVAVSTAAFIHFFLGVFMVALSMIIVYRPSLLFARNRPAPFESEWSKYPIWYDNVLLANSIGERSIPVKNLMTEEDGYLMWRYEYVLANIYGTPHLVKPDGLVPKDSTHVFRDSGSGRVIGKARYSGFFM
jgi:hypothetical protein